MPLHEYHHVNIVFHPVRVPQSIAMLPTCVLSSHSASASFFKDYSWPDGYHQRETIDWNSIEIENFALFTYMLCSVKFLPRRHRDENRGRRFQFKTKSTLRHEGGNGGWAKVIRKDYTSHFCKGETKRIILQYLCELFSICNSFCG